VDPRFFRWHEIPTRVPKEGVTMRVVSGDKGMMVFFDIGPHTEIPPHSHPHEQMGTVLEGEITLIIGNEERLLNAGDGYVAPSGVAHGARTGNQGAKVVDFFSPPREDYR